MNREPFQHAVPNPGVHRLIAEQLADGADPAEIAARYGISVSTAHRYGNEFEGAQRRVATLTDFEREAIRQGCGRGSRRRWVRQYGARVLEMVLVTLENSAAAPERCVPRATRMVTPHQSAPGLTRWL